MSEGSEAQIKEVLSPKERLRKEDQKYVEELLEKGEIKSHQKEALLYTISIRRSLSKIINRTKIKSLEETSDSPLKRHLTNALELSKHEEVPKETADQVKSEVRKSISTERSMTQSFFEMSLQNLASISDSIYFKRLSEYLKKNNNPTEIPTRHLTKWSSENIPETRQVLILATKRVPLFPDQILRDLKVALSQPEETKLG